MGTKTPDDYRRKADACRTRAHLAELPQQQAAWAGRIGWMRSRSTGHPRTPQSRRFRCYGHIHRGAGNNVLFSRFGPFCRQPRWTRDDALTHVFKVMGSHPIQQTQELPGSALSRRAICRQSTSGPRRLTRPMDLAAERRRSRLCCQMRIRPSGVTPIVFEHDAG